MQTSLLKKSLVLLAAMAVTFTASAGNTGPYVGLFGGANWVQDQQVSNTSGTVQNKFGFDTGYMFGASFGWVIPEVQWIRPEIEIGYRHNNYDAVTGTNNSENVTGNEDAWTSMLNIWHDVRTQTGFFSVVHPYIGGGIGAITIEMHNPTIDGVQSRSGYGTGFAWQGGAGLAIDIHPQVAITFDYRHLEGDRRTYGSSAGPVDARYRSDSAIAGVRYAFFQPEPPPRRVVAERSRPLPVPPREEARDNDSDGDGVPDSRDRCPGTPRGFAVNADGCIEEDQTVVLRGVNFVFNSDQLTGPAKETLKEVAAALAAQPSLNVRIVGHTDSVGSNGYNQRLSQKRADSVRRYLIAQGADASNLQARGEGESNPVASNGTEEGRAENRRVEFVVTNKPSDVQVKTAEPTEESKAAAQAGEPRHLKNK